MRATDILLDPDKNFQVVDGDFAIGESDPQHIEFLLASNKGHWRQDGFVGVGLQRYLSGPFSSAVESDLQREIEIQLERDGFQVLKVDLSNPEDFILNAERIK